MGSDDRNGGRFELDAIDQRIIAVLRRDGRIPFRALANEVDATESTVRMRVRRLEESGYMRVVAVTDSEAAGYGLLVAVGIQVEGRPADAVADELAAFPEIFSVCQVVGTLDIEALVVARDQEQLTELLTERLARVPGVYRIQPAVAIDVLKNQPDWVPLKPLAPAEQRGSRGDDG